MLEQATQALAELDRSLPRARLPVNQLVADALVVALGIVVDPFVVGRAQGGC